MRERKALRRSIFDMLVHMTRGCTRVSWTIPGTRRSPRNNTVGHKGHEDKGMRHVLRTNKHALVLW